MIESEDSSLGKMMILGRLGAVSSTHDGRPKIVSTIRQDVVFFDGMSTDQLTNRLADDAMLMLPPLGWALTHLLESTISLGGGLFMCASGCPGLHQHLSCDRDHTDVLLRTILVRTISV